MKKHKFEMLVLECRPGGSDQINASRMLTCVEFTRAGLLKIKGKPNHSSFPIKIKHVTGEVESNTANVISVGRGCFMVQLKDPSKSLQRWK
jgi:hypothetical protein